MGDNGKKKKIALIGVGLLVVAVVGTVAVTFSLGGSSTSTNGEQTAPLVTTSKSIKSNHEPTDYRQTCEKVLTSVVANSTDPKALVEATFKVTMDHLHEGISHSTTLQVLAKDPSMSDALENCKELLDYSIDDLHNSINQLTGVQMNQIDKAIDDLMIWLSVVITYQETCLNGFDNASSPAAESMKKALKTSNEQIRRGAQRGSLDVIVYMVGDLHGEHFT